MSRKGIILAGGKGSRLYPLTISVSKQLLPVYDKPMIYYPLTTLMLSGIRDILIICKPEDLKAFESLLSDGEQWGVRISYAQQMKPLGIAEALLIGKEFIGFDPITLILGDNIFYSQGMVKLLERAGKQRVGATIFCYYVKNPQDYGVVSLDLKGNPIDITEKPRTSESNYAVTGLYFFDNRAVEIASDLKPSKRGELEITDVNLDYLRKGELSAEVLSRGSAWLDMGQKESLLDASNFVRIVEDRQGLKIGCPEEVAYRMGMIDLEALVKLAAKYQEGSYQEYLKKIAVNQSI